MYSILILATGLGLAQAEENKTAKSMQVANNISFRVQGAQELLYRGLFTEEARSSRVQFQRSYRVESRCLVLETEKNSSLLACLTILKQRNNPALLPTITSEPPATSVRLETFRCDSKGIIQPGHNLGKISLEGPSTIEYGYLLELPKTKLVENDTWETNEDGRPVCIWTVLGTEMVQGVKPHNPHS